jgi:WD40 repeat protein
LPGHNAQVTVVKHIPVAGPTVNKGKEKDHSASRHIVSGDEQGNVIFWNTTSSSSDDEGRFDYTCGWQKKVHEGAVSSLAVFTSEEATPTGLFLTGGNDGIIKVFTWKLQQDAQGGVTIEESQTIKLGGRIPLDLAVAYLPDSQGEYRP